MIKVFRKASVKWSLLVVVLVVVLVAITLTNAKANASRITDNVSSADAIGTVTSVTNANSGKQMKQITQTPSSPDGSFDYQAYLSFTPLLPSYTAGYQLTLSRISCSQNVPPGNNSNTYLAAYGNHAAFTISEARSGEMFQTVIQHTFPVQETKTQIQIGDLPATLTVDKTVDAAHIQFTKDNVEYIVSSVPGGGVSQDELKRISTSITNPADSSPTDIYIDKMGPTASEGLSFKSLQPGDIAVPQGYVFQHESSDIYIKGAEKSEVFSLYYTKGTSSPFLNVQMSIGNHPYGDPTSVQTPNSDFDTKQIHGTEVRLRKTLNGSFPASQFTLKNGVKLSIYSPVMPESEVEKVVNSILQAS